MKLITNPDEFFTELKRRNVRIKVPLLTIVLPLAIIMAIYQFLLISKLSQVFPREIAQFFMIDAYIEIISTFIGVFAAWVLMAAIMHGLSSFLVVEVNSGEPLSLSVNGFLPSLVGEIITLPMSLVLYI